MKTACSTLLIALLFLFGCSEDKPQVGGLEVYEYYPDGTVKSIGNYANGKQKRRSPGFHISETYGSHEIFSVLDSLRILPLLKNMNGYVSNCIGYATPENKRRIEEILERESSSEFMKNIQFAWSYTPENMGNDQVYMLHALKRSANKDFTVTNKDIAIVEKTRDEQSAQITLNVTLTKKGKGKFARLTSDNVGKPLAIVINDLVLSAPIVNEMIAGGELVIAGNFTDQEASELEGLMNHSVLHGEYREYHPNGKLKTIMNFENGEQVGAYSRYDQNGKLIKKYGS